MDLMVNSRPFPLAKAGWFSLFLGAFILTANIHPRAQGTALDALKEKFRSGYLFKGSFDHQLIDSYTGDTATSSGTIWVGEVRYRVETENQIVVVDGETSMVYDKNKNRVIISEYEASEDDFAPSRILSGIDSTYTASREKKTDDEIHIRLASEDVFAMYKSVEIILTRGLNPRRIEATDPAENKTITQFSDGHFIPADPAIFKPDFPDDAEVIDL